MEPIKWLKQSATIDIDGTRIVYNGEGTHFVIISDKQHIPHAGRPGYWDHTTFTLLDFITDWSKEFQTLKEAKAYAENMIKENE